jgi:hypothetical protein
LHVLGRKKESCPTGGAHAIEREEGKEVTVRGGGCWALGLFLARAEMVPTALFYFFCFLSFFYSVFLFKTKAFEFFLNSNQNQRICRNVLCPNDQEGRFLTI